MLRSFTKSVFSLLLVAGLATASFSQDDAPKPITKSGSAAWLFSFNGLGSFGVGGLSVGTGHSTPAYAAGFKTFISDDMAIRAMLGFSTSSSGHKDSTGGARSNTTMGIGAGIEMHAASLYSISPYFGAQVSYGMHGEKMESGSVENSEDYSQIGIGAFAGFDWYFAKGMFFGAEYMLGFSTASSSETFSGNSVDNPSSTWIGIASGNVHLGVHF